MYEFFARHQNISPTAYASIFDYNEPVGQNYLQHELPPSFFNNSLLARFPLNLAHKLKMQHQEEQPTVNVMAPQQMTEMTQQQEPQAEEATAEATVEAEATETVVATEVVLADEAAVPYQAPEKASRKKAPAKVGLLYSNKDKNA
jgi:hypothetical protein